LCFGNPRYDIADRLVEIVVVHDPASNMESALDILKMIIVGKA